MRGLNPQSDRHVLTVVQPGLPGGTVRTPSRSPRGSPGRGQLCPAHPVEPRPGVGRAGHAALRGPVREVLWE